MLKPYFLPVLILAALWTIPWKGIALWKSARRRDRIWFIALFILNTLALLEILYIFVFSRKDKSRTFLQDIKPAQTEHSEEAQDKQDETIINNISQQ